MLCYKFPFDNLSHFYHFTPYTNGQWGTFIWIFLLHSNARYQISEKNFMFGLVYLYGPILYIDNSFSVTIPLLVWSLGHFFTTNNATLTGDDKRRSTQKRNSEKLVYTQSSQPYLALRSVPPLTGHTLMMKFHQKNSHATQFEIFFTKFHRP